MVGKLTPVREYKKPPKTMDDPHELVMIQRLGWPLYDVYVWHGAGELAQLKDVPHSEITRAIDKLRKDHPDAGVIGLREVCNWDAIEAAIIAKYREPIDYS